MTLTLILACCFLLATAILWRTRMVLIMLAVGLIFTCVTWVACACVPGSQLMERASLLQAFGLGLLIGFMIHLVTEP
jgi:hypothetical protein